MQIGLYDIDYPDEGPLWAGRLDRIEGNRLYGEFLPISSLGYVHHFFPTRNHIDFLPGEAVVRL